jgi:hypothetical protein
MLAGYGYQVVTFIWNSSPEDSVNMVGRKPFEAA